MIRPDSKPGDTVWCVRDDDVVTHVLSDDDFCRLESSTTTDPNIFSSELAAWEELAGRRRLVQQQAQCQYLAARRRVQEAQRRYLAAQRQAHEAWRAERRGVTP